LYNCRVLAPYRRVLSVPGAWRFSLAGFLGRLTVSMVGLGIVLLVSAESGSYALAGTMVSAYLLANAVFAVGHGRLLDRLGQARVLPWVELVFALALALMVWGVLAGAPSWLVHGLAGLSGAAHPQVGSCVRARWSHVLHEDDELQTAYALEGVVDEGLFVLGPTAVTLLATSWHPVAGLAAALTCGVAGTLWLATQRGTEPPALPRGRDGGGAPTRMPWSVVVPLALVFLAMGAVFGATEVVTVAFAEERDAKHLAGPLLGLWALGSLAAGLVSGAVAWKVPPGTRVRWGVLVLGLTLVPLALVDSLVLLAVLLLLGGMAIAPTLIATLAVLERALRHGRLTEGMAILHTAMGIGVAPGATVAGHVVDGYGASPAYVVPAVAGLLGALAAWLSRSGRAARP
jgi:MFS family permease